MPNVNVAAPTTVEPADRLTLGTANARFDAVTISQVLSPGSCQTCYGGMADEE